MDRPFNIQLFSGSSCTALSLLHGLKKIVSSTNYNFGAVYQTIDGPHYIGPHYFETSQDILPILSLLGGDQMTGKYAKYHRLRQRQSFTPEDLFERSGLPEEPFCADDLAPMGHSIAVNGPVSPSHASYLVHIDILADSRAHRALHSIGQTEFDQVPGWLSETLFESVASHGISGTPKANSAKRYVCMQAFDHQSNLSEIALMLQDFKHGTLDRGSGYANCKVRLCKLFGSVERKV